MVQRNHDWSMVFLGAASQLAARRLSSWAEVAEQSTDQVTTCVIRQASPHACPRGLEWNGSWGWDEAGWLTDNDPHKADTVTDTDLHHPPLCSTSRCWNSAHAVMLSRTLYCVYSRTVLRPAWCNTVVIVVLNIWSVHSPHPQTFPVIWSTDSPCPQQKLQITVHNRTHVQSAHHWCLSITSWSSVKTADISSCKQCCMIAQGLFSDARDCVKIPAGLAAPGAPNTHG